jgi:heme/copper-type cytochrome/quinol oxidase subunit 2
MGAGRRSMRSLIPVALSIAGFLVLVFLGLLFKVALGQYVVFLLVFVGLSFIVTLVAFLLFIFTVPLGTSSKNDNSTNQQE